MRGAVLASLLLGVLGTACNSLLHIDDFHTVDAGGDDGAPLDMPDSGDPLCFGSLTEVCLTALPTGPLTLNSGTVDTDNLAGCLSVIQPSQGAKLCVMAGTDVTVSGTNHVTGSRALVLIATSTITVNGQLDASSTRVGTLGAAADDASCSLSLPGGDNTNGGGGGGGGSFAGAGGAGGDGQLGSNNGGNAGGSVGQVSFVRGGCSGARGGNGQGGASAGAPGHSGGALYLIARGAIVIGVGGGVFASGAGGGRANNGGSRGGGGGGGSGGLVALDAPAITVDGTVAANGGGGGGGAELGNANDGSDGTTQNFNTPATGGRGENNGQKGGDGGDGGFLSTNALDGKKAVQSNSAGGGGGGGSVGFVWTKGTLNGTRISPPPSKH